MLPAKFMSAVCHPLPGPGQGESDNPQPLRSRKPCPMCAMQEAFPHPLSEHHPPKKCHHGDIRVVHGGHTGNTVVNYIGFNCLIPARTPFVQDSRERPWFYWFPHPMGFSFLTCSLEEIPTDLGHNDVTAKVCECFVNCNGLLKCKMHFYSCSYHSNPVCHLLDCNEIISFDLIELN